MPATLTRISDLADARTLREAMHARDWCQRELWMTKLRLDRTHPDHRDEIGRLLGDQARYAAGFAAANRDILGLMGAGAA